jgi:F0F1-type ATP synthase assembly protein I
MAEKNKREGSGEQIGESYRKAGPWLDASWQLSGSIAFWTFLGWFLDGKLGTRPWLLVSGAVLGISLGFYLFFRAIVELGKKRT